ncbi:ATP-binding protein [Emticicia sp. 17c]|uniref:ATP-binding protein n=1 Tax=Emticicia sp. 17c TaxID=3127704 RepID=UPI00301E4703
MRKPILILLLMFPVKFWGQTPKNDSLQTVLRQLITQPVSVKRDSSLTVSLYSICSMISLAEPELRQVWTDSLKRFSKTSSWRQSNAYSHLAISRNYHLQGYTSLAFKEMELAIKYFRRFQNEKMYLIAFGNLSVIITNYFYNKPIVDTQTEKKYLSYLLDGLMLMKKQGNPMQIANMDLSLMQYYLRHKDYHTAMQYAIESWVTTKNDPDKYFYQYFAGKWYQGLCLMFLGKQEEGFRIINQIKVIARQPRKDGMDKYLLTSNGLSLGNYYLEKKDYENAIKEAKVGEEALKSMKLTIFDYALNKIFYESYKNLGKPQEALAYFEKMQLYEQHIEHKEALGQYLEWQLKYEDEKQKNQIQSLENQQLTQTRNFLLIGGLLGLCVVIYVFFVNRKLRKKNQDIQEALLQGQTMERKRMASELHDNISNKILGVKMRVELLENEYFTPKERANYDSTLRFIDEVYADVRLVSHNLLPDELEKHGLIAAVENLIKKLNLIGKTQFDAQIQINQVSFSPRISYEIYSIILELVNNVLKHAQAKNAVIAIIETEGYLTISVKDNGKGFDSHQINLDSLGLKNIHSRIQSLRGHVRIHNEGGTEVLIVIPV